MTKTLTKAEFEKRNQEFELAERLADDAHTQAAFAEATDTGSEAETAKARKHLEGIRQKRETLRLAFRESQKKAVERRQDKRKEASSDLVGDVNALLAKRAEQVAAIIDLSDKLGAALKAYLDTQDHLRRLCQNYAQDYRRDLPVRGRLDGLHRALEFGHDVRVIPGAIIDLRHDLNVGPFTGNRHALRGQDPIEIDVRGQEAVKDHVGRLVSIPGDE